MLLESLCLHSGMSPGFDQSEGSSRLATG